MATPNAIAVALFNAAAGGYSGQLAADTNSLANAVGLILQKDISNDAQFVEHLLTNFGVTSSLSIYLEAKNALTNLVLTQGRGKAAITAIDFLKTQEAAPNEYALVALNFAVKVSDATLYSARFSNERDITKLVSAITGIDTDQVAINEALNALNPAFSATLQSALAAADTKAKADQATALAVQKAQADAAAKTAAEKAVSDLKVAQDKAIADAAAAKVALDKVATDAAATLKTANDRAAEAAAKAAADLAAAVTKVDTTADNGAAITAYLKTNAALLGLTGYESMTDVQLLNIIKYSDNQTVAAAVDKTIDNPAAITDYLKKTASDLGATGTASMNNTQLINAIKIANDTAVAAAQKATDDLAASAVKVVTDAAAAKAAADLLTAQAQIQNVQTPAGKNVSLTVDTDSILAVSGGNDTITATSLTYGSSDLVVDSSLVDADVLNLSATDDISATPVVVGIENMNVNVTSVYGGDVGPTILSFNASSVRSGTLNFDVTNPNSVVTGLTITNLALGVPVTSSIRYTTANISAVDKAVVNYNGWAGALTIDSPGTLADVTAIVKAATAGTFTTDSDKIVTLTTSADTTVTAATASSVFVTSGGQATVTANTATAVSVTATEEAFITANAANTVTFATGDGIDTTSASAIASTLTSTNANNITVNVSGRAAATVVDLSGAANVSTVNVSGTQNVTVRVGLVGIDGIGTTTSTLLDDNLFVVTNTNTGTTTLFIKTTGGDADFSQANVNSIVVGADLGPLDDLTLASGALVVTAFDQTNDLDLIAKNSASNVNSVRITVQDNAAAGVDGDLAGGLKLTTFATATLTNNDANSAAILGAVSATGTALTLASGTQGFTASSSINMGSGSLSVTGAGAVNLGSAVTAGSVLGSGSLSAITIGLTGLDFVGNVTTGLGSDVLSISSAVRNNSANYTIATGTGADTLTLSIVQGFSWDGGGDYDTLRVSGSLDLTGKTVTLTSVDEIYLDVASAGAGTLTISSTTFNTNPIFNVRGTTGGADTLIVQGLATADTVNANLVSVESSFAALRINGLAGNDTLTGSAWADTIDGGTGNDLMSGGNGGDTYIFISGDVDAGETIVESSTGTGTDTVSVSTSTDFRLMVASSFDEIEAITLAAGLTAKFTGLQLTGESMVVTGTAGSAESVEVYVGVGEQFTSALTDAAGTINNTYLIGSTGDESIAGGAMTETITGGTGNDVLSGGAGNDTYVFELAATNGIDRITFGAVDGTAIDDKLDMSINVFLGDGAPDIGLITEANTATTLTSNVAGDNILILRNAYYADAAALSSSTLLFAASFNAAGKVVFIYASSATADARMAIATISDPGVVSAAVDIAVLVGITVTEAATGFATTNFSL